MNMKQQKLNRILPYASAVFFFCVACILQQMDDNVSNQHISKFMSLLSQCIFFGISTFWIVSVISRVSAKEIRNGLVTTAILMNMLMFLKLVKYNVVFNPTAERYLWYAYYIPQCLAPVVFLLTASKMNRKNGKKTSSLLNLLFLPSAFLILFVFTNDFHEQVFSFEEGLMNGNQVYHWEWGYYIIFCWISGLYLTSGILLCFKCRISQCRKKAWIPLVLFIVLAIGCLLREVFNPLFIKMPETVAFSVIIVSESLIGIGLIPSNTEYVRFFDAADISAMIADKSLHIKLSSKQAPRVTEEQLASVVKKEEVTLTKDLTLKSKEIHGGTVFWAEDKSVINGINDELFEINQALAEETDLLAAENRMKEQRLRIEEQNILYKEIHDIARPGMMDIQSFLSRAKTEQEKEDALRYAIVHGVFLKRRSNLMLTRKDGQIPASEINMAFHEISSAIRYCHITSALVSDAKGFYPSKDVMMVLQYFEDCLSIVIVTISFCLIRISEVHQKLFFRLIMDKASDNMIENLKSIRFAKGDIDIKTEEGETYLTFSIDREEKR